MKLVKTDEVDGRPAHSAEDAAYFVVWCDEAIRWAKEKARFHDESERREMIALFEQGPVSTAASIEFGFATPDYVICETVDSDVPWRHDIALPGYKLDEKTRTVRASEKPGLGIEIDEKEVAKHPYKEELLQRVFYSDGSVGDW